MIDLCKYYHLHGAEKTGYCSDVCRRSMELFLSGKDVVEMFTKEKSSVAVRRFACAIDALR
jgi:hypothetical protein